MMAKNVRRYEFARGAFDALPGRLDERRDGGGWIAILADHYFADGALVARARPGNRDLVRYVDTSDEPTTDYVDEITAAVRDHQPTLPAAVVGIGGGSTLDIAKAVSNLLGNGGRAEDYQGWDLLTRPGVYKIGVPTLSGTGAETSRTCVMMNYAKNLKLGMNSEHTVYDELVLDPALSATVPRQQYFCTAMDTYIHCIESLAGSHRHAVGDAFSKQAIELCREVFAADDMMEDGPRETLMVASYLGGCAIASSLVGLVHPLSAALSVVLGYHHTEANCIALEALDEFYPAAVAEFRAMKRAQGIVLPTGVCAGLSDEDFRRLHLSAVVHEKPLRNALGDGFRDVLNEGRVRALFEAM